MADERICPMTLDEFEGVLKQLTPGQGAHLAYDIYGQLFPPGEPDEAARARAYDFARSHSCQIENHPNQRVVVFYKPSVESDIPF
jgi:hypothetical protein